MCQPMYEHMWRHYYLVVFVSISNYIGLWMTRSVHSPCLFPFLWASVRTGYPVHWFVVDYIVLRTKIMWNINCGYVVVVLYEEILS